MLKTPKIRIHALASFDRSAKLRWLLTELGVPFEVRTLSRDAKENESPDYLKLNPMGRVPTVELMIKSPLIRDLLREGKTTDLYKALMESSYFGCQTFNQSIVQLYRDELIDLETAMGLADNPDELKMELRGIVKGTRASDFDFGPGTDAKS